MSALRAGTALAAGVLFGLGLALSGMINPAKVLGFLDIFGTWDPSLAAVMATAIPVTWVFYRLSYRRGRALSAAALPPPPSPVIDRPLVLGALLFGVGWGLVGFCPGPALATLVLEPRSWLFLVALIAGMLLRRLVYRWL